MVLTEEQKRQIDQKLGPEPGREQPPETSEQAPGSLGPGALPQPTEPPSAAGPVTTQPPRPQPQPSAIRPLPVTEAPPPAAPAPTPAPRRRSTGELWLEAKRLKSSHSYHSLRSKLDEILAGDSYHADAQKWRGKCPGWIREHEKDLTEEVNDRLDELTEGIDDRDLEDVLEPWGKRSDPATERYFADLFSKYKVCKARFTLESIKVHDGAANFTARIVIEAKSKRGRDVPFETVLQRNWNGQLFDDGDRKRFSRSFP
ncbi:MAG: hypothetical protein GY856_42485 [bacterium]|nr:hypothetical protein [bacterium]